MQHFDQHTLELYALKAQAVAESRAEIEAHLAVCAGCRDLVARMGVAYDRTAELMRELDPAPAAPGGHLPVATSRTLVTGASRRGVGAPLRPPGRMERAQYFMRRHPVATGAGSFMLLGALALLAFAVLRPSSFREMRPASVRYNVQGQTVEILDRDDKVLWPIPTFFSPADLPLEGLGITRTVVRDLNGDGRSEVVTALWSPGDTPMGSGAYFKVYEHDGTLRFRKNCDATMPIVSGNYGEDWGAASCAVSSDPSLKEKDIFIAWNAGRSPEIVARYHYNGDELGRYWHFGVVYGMYFLDVDGNGGEELVLSGIDDAEDSLGFSYPFIAVLDPGKITGSGRSCASGVFPMATSDAEIYYIRFPVPPLTKAMSQNAEAGGVRKNRNGTLAVWVQNGILRPADELESYEFIFGPDMALREVKSTTGTELLYQQKLRDGLVSGRIDHDYLAALKDGLRYWNGERWVKEAVRIRHPVHLAHRRR